MWHRAAAAMTGVSARIALRRTLRDVLRSELGDLDEAAVDSLVAAERGGGATDVRLARGEREIWLSTRAALLRDPVADQIGTVYALRDVSQDRQLDQLKSDFVATVSHELRTPLTSIYGFAETLLREDVDFPEEDRTTFLRYIASEAERLTRLVDGLLSVTRLEAGGVQLDLMDVDVCDVLREIVVRESGRLTERHRLELLVPAKTLVAAADRDKLRQIVLNLVDNAIKYSPNGGAITVSAQRRLDVVEIRVQDDGIGISLIDHGDGITALVLDGRTSEVHAVAVPYEAGASKTLPAVVGDLVQAVDSERGRTPVPEAVAAVVDHPTFQRLSKVIGESTVGERPVWLTAHRYLVQAPLQLLGGGDEALGRCAIVPRLSIVERLPPPTRWAGPPSLVVIGDPLGDLPFARAEARLVARGGGALALGDAATSSWLAGELGGSGGGGVLHIACHGRYDGAHPERSGLLFAVPADQRVPGAAGVELVNLDRLIHLPLRGNVVVLSACNSGNETVRDGDEASGVVSAAGFAT